jgi:hypothetical protein
MKKNIAIGVLAVLSLALLGMEAARYFGSVDESATPEDQARENNRRVLTGLEARMAKMQEDLLERDEELARLRNAIGRQDQPDVQAGAMPSAVQRPPERMDDEVAEAAAEPLAGLSEQIAGLLSNTNLLKSMIAQGMRGALTSESLELEYGDFFRELGLNDEQVAAALELLKNRNPLASIAGIEALAGDDEDTFGNQMRELLGEDGYEAYKRFDETRNARQMVSGFQNFLADKNLALDDAQRGRLVEMFHQTGAAYDGNELGGGLTFSMNGADGAPMGETIDDSLDKLVVKYDQLAKQAGDLLDDGQAQQLRAYLDAQLERKEMEGDIARNILPALNLNGIEGFPVQGSVQVIAAPSVVVPE